MSNIKDQIVTLLKQRHHSHKVALDQEKDPRSKHAVDLIARIREDSQLIELIDSLPEETCKDSLQVPESCKENTDSFTSLAEAADDCVWKSIDNNDPTLVPKFIPLLISLFISGAYWQKEQMELDGIVTLTESDFDAEKEKASEWGYNLCKEQMMKKVKYGVVCKNGERDEEDVWIELNPGSLPDYKDTDPIDFIIVKQDDRPRD